jgi:hypothetical protein
VTGENVSEEITNRLIAANRAHFGLKSQLESQLLPKKKKILIYKTLVRAQKTEKKQKMMKDYLQKENPSQNI